MRSFILSCAIGITGAAMPPAHAEEPLHRCFDAQGVLMLSDRPCETMIGTVRRHVPEKEYFVLPPSEQGRGHWVRKAPLREPPKIDVETLRLARQALDLRDKVASAR
ncbi:hypothetical protein ABT364_12420 [Massilia sp. SR12]